MAQLREHVCHTVTTSETPKSTLRLNSGYDQIVRWADHHGIYNELETIYQALQLGSDKVAIGNFFEELSQPGSAEILEDWSHLSICKRFKKILDCYQNSPEIRTSYPPITAAKNVKSQFGGELKNRFFLLAMITNPLAYTENPKTYHWRRKLRLWLLIQATTRYEVANCSADKNISIAARKLILRPSIDEKKWRVIDRLQHYVEAKLDGVHADFELLSLALGHGAAQLHDAVSERSDRTFLNAIEHIAAGDVDPIQSTHSQTPLGRTKLTDFFPQLQSAAPIFVTVQDHGDSFESDEAIAFVETKVNPEQSFAQQTLSQNSVLFQTAELSHYLPWSWTKVLPHELSALTKWVNRELGSSHENRRLGGACVWLALNLGRT
ncbi:MAG: hypothetical protein OQJ91_08695, partial [Motiliproteus sp.]|nr:hypothetical protein [Motiliproteus sp.]